MANTDEKGLGAVVAMPHFNSVGVPLESTVGLCNCADAIAW